MSKVHSVVLIPYWIYDNLDRNNLNISECLKMDTLKNIFSVEDLAGFAAGQDILNDLTGCIMPTYDLEREWLATCNEQSADFIRKVVNPSRFNSVGSVRTRLLNPEFANSKYNTPFITYDLTPTALGIVIYPGFFTTVRDDALQFSLIKEILQAFYERNIAPVEVSPLPLFKRYLDLLSERTV